MRKDHERDLALECLKIAEGDIKRARAMLDFVLGETSEATGVTADARDKDVNP